MAKELESRIVHLADGDEVEIYGPFIDPTYLYYSILTINP